MQVKTELSHLELEILNDILDNKIEGTKKHEMSYPTVAYIAWIENGKVEMGPVRWGHRNSMPKQCDRWSASPFPGAWSDVPMKDIVRVRHIDAI
jgi:hypothetical protein